MRERLGTAETAARGGLLQRGKKGRRAISTSTTSPGRKAGKGFFFASSAIRSCSSVCVGRVNRFLISAARIGTRPSRNLRSPTRSSAAGHHLNDEGCPLEEGLPLNQVLCGRERARSTPGAPETRHLRPLPRVVGCGLSALRSLCRQKGRNQAIPLSHLRPRIRRRLVSSRRRLKCRGDCRAVE